MVKSICQLAVIGLLFWAPVASAWGLFGPKTVEECILENMKGVTSDAAAKSIEAACFEKYYQPTQKKQCKLRELNKTEAEKVTADFYFRDIGGPYLTLRIYNGSEVQVEKIKAYVAADNIKPGQVYVLNLVEPIKPKSTADTGIQIQALPTKNAVFGVFQKETCDK